MAGIISFVWTETKSWYTRKNGSSRDVTVNFNGEYSLTIDNISDGCTDDFRVLVIGKSNNKILISPSFKTYNEARKHYIEIVKLFHGTENPVVLYNYDTGIIEYLD